MTQETTTQIPPIDLSDQAVRTELADLQDMVDDLIVYLHEAKTVPLSGNAIVDREQFLGLLERIRTGLPDELRAAALDGPGAGGVHRPHQREGP